MKGHRLTMDWNGERGEESSTTGECLCGWTEAASTQNEVRREYRTHLLKEEAREIAAETGEDMWVVYDRLRAERRAKR